MLDLKFIRENPDIVTAGLAKKYDDTNIPRILEIDDRRREIVREVEALKAQRNRVSGEIAQKKKAGQSAEEAVAAMKQVGHRISELDGELRTVEEELRQALIRVPNLPHESVPVGPDESAAQILKLWGERPDRDFKVLPHWEIGEKLRIMDFPPVAKVSGSGFYLLKGIGARLERALINFMIDMHLADGFVEHSVPFIVNEQAMLGTGQLPKMDDDMYKTTPDSMYLVPTGEVPLTNLFREQILSHQELPIYMVAYTPCFRREAGAAGKDTRGMLRVHQFHKVELVKIVRPESSYDELESLLVQAEKVIQALGIPYRIAVLASGDLSFASAKTYDIEIWAAGVAKWLEISSVSNFEDFQARRMNCRFRDEGKKVRFVHTLNGSGVALARLVPTILENYQNADGTVTVPEILRPYLGGVETIS